MPHTLSNKRQTIRQVMSGRVSEYICMSDSMPEYMSDKMSEYVSVSNKMSNGMSCRNIYYGGGHSNSVSECLCGVLPVDLNLHAHTHIYIYIYSTATSGNNNAPCFSNSGSNPFQPVPSTYSCGTFGGRYSSFTSMSSPGIPNGSLWLPGQSTHGEKTWDFFVAANGQAGQSKWEKSTSEV